jgi:formate hydrogenlyase subunit 3/multisubunit Na+/H+ antiporter MnhD subunit
MTAHWLWISLVYPLVGAFVLMGRKVPGMVVSGFLRTAALPAAIAVVAVPLHQSLVLPWLQMGTQFELDEIRRIFLLFTSLLWLIAGWYGVRYLDHDQKRQRFTVFYLLSLMGNLGLIIAADIPTFYTCFAIMTFSAYGLVVHQQNADAARAGRLYIALAVVGEALILSALLLIAFNGQTLLIADAVAAIPGSRQAPLIMGLVIFGFGVKTGLLPLHGWLPLAHPVAPTPASAVLSGSMIKAGLLGWILFLPGGYGDFPAWSHAMMALGLLGAFYAVAVGLTQRNPKTNLAYSSISQMGVMTICLGLGLAHAKDWSNATLIVAIYALNHAFAKGALFMGVGVVMAEPLHPRFHRRIIFAGLALAALAIAGAPMTGGALAKRALKYFADSANMVWSPALTWLLPLSALATTLLLTRLMYLLYRKMIATDREPDEHPGLMTVWSVNLLAVALMAWLTIHHLQVPVSIEPFRFTDLTKSASPIVVGLLIAWGIGRFRPRPVTPVAAGDIVVGFERVGQWIAAQWIRWIATPLESRTTSLDPLLNRILPPAAGVDRVRRADERMRFFGVSGSLFILLMVALMWSLR